MLSALLFLIHVAHSSNTTLAPTAVPSANPTAFYTSANPTAIPSNAPSPPTASPTGEPTSMPTKTPTFDPATIQQKEEDATVATNDTLKNLPPLSGSLAGVTA